jgi:uncharacterized SAM-dependent methyltransferase
MISEKDFKLKKRTDIDEYIYDTPYREIRVYFYNNIFHHCEYSFTNRYDRDQWELLSMIEAEISAIEKSYKEKEIYGKDL